MPRILFLCLCLVALFTTTAWMGQELLISGSVKLPTAPNTAPGGGGGGIACDIGPNYQGSIPGPAQAYGFTHCLNFDFTYTGTFSNTSSFYHNGNNTTQVAAGQNYQWSNKSSWWDKAGAGSNALFTTFSGFNDANMVQIVTDTVSGQQALLLQVFTSNDNTRSQMISPIFPSTNVFIEETARVNPNDASYCITCDNGEVIDDFGYFDSAFVPNGSIHTGGYEVDFGLLCGVGPPMGCLGNGSFIANSTYIGEPFFVACCGNNIADGNYHTTGSLYVASRTQWKFAYCGYYDHQKGLVNFDHSQTYNCWSPVFSDGKQGCDPSETATDPVPYGCFQEGQIGLGSYGRSVSNTVQQWVSHLIIWTCPGWNTQTTAPAAVGGGTAYNTCDSGSVGVPTTGSSGPAWPSD